MAPRVSATKEISLRRWRAQKRLSISRLKRFRRPDTPGVEQIAIALDPAANGIQSKAGHCEIAGKSYDLSALVDYYEHRSTRIRSEA